MGSDSTPESRCLCEATEPGDRQHRLGLRKRFGSEWGLQTEVRGLLQLDIDNIDVALDILCN